MISTIILGVITILALILSLIKSREKTKESFLITRDMLKGMAVKK